MAAKPNADRVYEVLFRIIERRYDIKVKYILEPAGLPGHFLSDACCENVTNKKGEYYEYNNN